MALIPHPFSSETRGFTERQNKTPLVSSFDRLLNKVSANNLNFPADFAAEMAQTPDTTVFCANPDESQLYVRTLGTEQPTTWVLEQGEPIINIKRYFKVHLFITQESPDKPVDRKEKLKFMVQVMTDFQSLFEMLKTMLDSSDPEMFGKCPEMILAIAPHLTPELKGLGFEKVDKVIENGKGSDFSDRSWYALRVDSPTVEATLGLVKAARQRLATSLND